MKPSAENQIQAAEQQARTPPKQYTRQETEKHDSKNDCWLVIDNTSMMQYPFFPGILAAKRLCSVMQVGSIREGRKSFPLCMMDMRTRSCRNVRLVW